MRQTMTRKARMQREHVCDERCDEALWLLRNAGCRAQENPDTHRCPEAGALWTVLQIGIHEQEEGRIEQLLKVMLAYMEGVTDQKQTSE